MAKRRVIIASVLIAFFLLPLGIINLQLVKAQVQGFTINEAGAVVPSTAPIQKVGDTYFLTSDISETITIQKSNIIFNGGENEISGVPIYGFQLDSVQNVTVENCVITDCAEGIELNNTSDVLVTNNTISNQASITLEAPSAAISIYDGVSNTIQENAFSDDSIGIGIVSFNRVPCTDNLVVANDFTGCYSVFLLYYSSNNTIYHNNFIDSGSFGLVDDMGYAYGIASVEIWDNGFPNGGNYWGYQTGKEIGTTGISDTPYIVNADENTYPQNVDWYPLVEPFNSAFLANYEQEILTPAVSVMSPSNETYSTTNISLSISIDKPFNWVGYSLDGQSNVTINGNTTIPDIAYGLHSITVYANSTFGIIGASETIEFSVVKPVSVVKPESAMSVIALLVPVTVIAVVIGLAVALLHLRRHRKTSYSKQ